MWGQAVSWTFTSFAILLSFGRFVIRKRLLGKLQMDDWSHAFALVLLIPYMALSTTIYPLAIEVGLFGKKDGPMPSKETLERFFRLEVAGQLFFWIILYAVKFTFLILFRQIFSVNKIFMRWWWAVFIYTCIAFWACFLEVFWICGSPSDIFVLSAYFEPVLSTMRANRLPEKCLTPHASGVVNNFAEVGLALNISSDLAGKFFSSQEVAYILTNSSHDPPHMFPARPANAVGQENCRGIAVLSRHGRRRYRRCPTRGR